MKIHILSFTYDGNTSVSAHRTEGAAWLIVVGILETDGVLEADEAAACRDFIRCGNIDEAEWKMQEACSSSSDYSWHIQSVTVPRERKPRPRIIVEVCGGVVNTVYANTACSVSVLDRDDERDCDPEDRERFRSLSKETKKLNIVL